ncbi:MAG: RNA-guided pseudouridylation complex pseudouridine synthase subunit Cbf5 [Methanobacteriaceae archaeon]|nr:RNA-guided pseudouridylation complex pseudouridine synthase subunit Cbf5 [Methanobacteriaceae archaeon]
MVNYYYMCESNTDYDYGKVPSERSISEHISKGIINVDKPSGPTSHEIDSWVKHILNVGKTGHGGTLDPKVTGVLPMAINTATKSMELLLLSSKAYVCLMRLHEKIDEDKIYEIFDEFKGKVFQIPPVKSAVKRELRVRSIYENNIIEIDGQDILFDVTCEAGTYIRKYCHDMGEALGIGAHMAELRRIKAGPFIEDETLTTLQDITDAYYYWKNEDNEDELRRIIQPVEKVTDDMLKIYIKDSAVDAVCHGANLANSGIVKLDTNIRKNDVVAIMTLKDELVAAGKSLYFTDEIIEANTKIVVDIGKVFILPNTYPKMWK